MKILVAALVGKLFAFGWCASVIPVRDS